MVMPDAIDIQFAPLLPWPLIAALAAAGGAATAWGLYRRARGAGWRAVGFAVLVAALLNPAILVEQREARPDIALIAVDRSASQSIAGRPARTAAALAHVRERLSRLPDLEVRTIFVGDRAAGGGRGGGEGTRLFGAIRAALGEIPRRRLAGIVAITDGQAHDDPRLEPDEAPPGPFHAILTGAPQESDRRLVIEQAPAYGMVGQSIKLALRVADTATGAGPAARVTVRIDGRPAPAFAAPVGRSHVIELPIEHAGQTVVELEADPVPGELTVRNNRAVLSVTGVRDRLRVLLVSGAPHAGERAWRDLLKADPSVDLVHFTILRPPEKQDGTPIRELSLIAFPVRELFELKLDEFDLVIFDRYRRRGVLPRAYLHNVVDYVRGGGALLEASGPSFATRMSLARTPLAEILPARPTGAVVEAGFRPLLTDLGRRHPVTAGLAGDEAVDARDEEGAPAAPPRWGRWFRQIEAVPDRGHVLMSGVEGRPLLLVDRVGEGRVAHLLSDHIWLWNRGFEGGGPQAEMLRRAAHWLMREPELEENVLRARVNGDRLEIRHRSLEGRMAPVTVTAPDGSRQIVETRQELPGLALGQADARQVGLYRLAAGELRALVAVGALNPLEFQDVLASEAAVRPVADATGGGLVHAARDGLPGFRRVAPDRLKAGRGWLGMVANRDYVVTGLDSAPLLPPVLVLLLALAAAALAWRNEAR